MNPQDTPNSSRLVRGADNSPAASTNPPADNLGRAVVLCSEEPDTPLLPGPCNGCLTSSPRPHSPQDGPPPSLEGGAAFTLRFPGRALPRTMHADSCTEGISSNAAGMDGDESLCHRGSLQPSDGHPMAATAIERREATPGAGIGTTVMW